MSFENDFCTCSTIVNTNGYKLYCRYWEIKATPRAIVFISHGLGEHAQYYHPLASALNNMQCFVFAHDHVGHGRSEGPRASIESVDKFVQDVFQHTDLIRERYPAIPMFYIGNSMGGTIGAEAVLKRPHYFKGAIFIGPGILVSPEAAHPLLIQLSKFVGWIFPSLPVAKMDYSLTNRDDSVVKVREKDPFSLHGYVKAGITKAMLAAMEDIQEHVHVIKCPLLLLHGEDDKVCSIEGSRMVYEKCSSTDKTLKTFPEAYHDLLHEPDGIKEQAIDNITEWIEERIHGSI